MRCRLPYDESTRFCSGPAACSVAERLGGVGERLGGVGERNVQSAGRRPLSWPSSFDPYVGLSFRLLVDFLLTESIHRLVIVLLWIGLGLIISDVTPAFSDDKNLHRFYRCTGRFIRHFDWNSLKISLPSSTISPVRFYDIPSFGPPAPSASAFRAGPTQAKCTRELPRLFLLYRCLQSPDLHRPPPRPRDFLPA